MARINIIIPDKILEKCDEYSKFSGYSRSEFIRHLIRQFFMKLKKEKND